MREVDRVEGRGGAYRSDGLFGQGFPGPADDYREGEAREELGRRRPCSAWRKTLFFRGFVPNRDLPRHYSVADVGVFRALPMKPSVFRFARPWLRPAGGDHKGRRDPGGGAGWRNRYLAEPRNPATWPKIGLLLKDENCGKRWGKKPGKGF